MGSLGHRRAVCIIVSLGFITACDYSDFAGHDRSDRFWDKRPCVIGCIYAANDDFRKMPSRQARPNFTLRDRPGRGNTPFNLNRASRPDANADGPGPKRLVRSFHTSTGGSNLSVTHYEYHAYNDRNVRLAFEARTPANEVLYTYHLSYEDEACTAPIDKYNFFGDCQLP